MAISIAGDLIMYLDNRALLFLSVDKNTWVVHTVSKWYIGVHILYSKTLFAGFHKEFHHTAVFLKTCLKAY